MLLLNLPIIPKEQLNNEEDIDVEVNRLTTPITNAGKASIKEENPKSRKSSYHITPNYIIDLIKEKSKTNREWQNTRAPQLKNKLNRLQHKITRELEELKIQKISKLD